MILERVAMRRNRYIDDSMNGKGQKEEVGVTISRGEAKSEKSNEG